MAGNKIENCVYGLKGSAGWQADYPVTFNGNVTVLGTLTAANESVTSEVITSANANAFAVGANGTTNPAFNVATNAANAATGLNIAANAAGSGVGLTVISSGTNEAVTFRAKGTGAINLGGGGNASISYSSPLLGFVTNANALAVGQNGTTSPALRVDTSTASSVTGVLVTAKVAGGGVAISTLSSNASESLTIDARGTAGVVNIQSTVATPASGSTAASLIFGTTAGFGIYYGSGVPTVTAGQGSIYLRSDGSSTSTRLYVNTNGTTGWTNFTSAT